MIQAADPPLILASTSATRAALLAACGLSVQILAPAVDEAAIKCNAIRHGQTDADTALALAELKAAAISHRHPHAVVIGVDQMLVCEGRRFDKPVDLAKAAEHLQTLSGRTHTLVTATVCHHDGARVWHCVTSPTLTMRTLSPVWIASYLDREGAAVLTAVGAYRIEALGLHCFSAIDGDYTSILGLPMLALLAFLREHGVLST